MNLDDIPFIDITPERCIELLASIGVDEAPAQPIAEGGVTFHWSQNNLPIIQIQFIASTRTIELLGEYARADRVEQGKA